MRFVIVLINEHDDDDGREAGSSDFGAKKYTVGHHVMHLTSSNK